jgi:hypothetical protein
MRRPEGSWKKLDRLCSMMAVSSISLTGMDNQKKPCLILDFRSSTTPDCLCVQDPTLERQGRIGLHGAMPTVIITSSTATPDQHCR